MTVNVLLFASYADAIGQASVQMDVGEGTSIGELVDRLRNRAGGAKLPPAPLVALNQTYATLTDVVRSGDEVAVIPPVAGG